MARSLLAAVLLLAMLLAVAKANPSAVTTLVNTTNGPVLGRELATTLEWTGVPYAAPPTGSLRWMPPTPPTPWTTPVATTAWGDACLQPQGQLFPPPTSFSEDCLNLNVWAPAGAAAGSLPTYVWIHGGAYVDGSGSQYNGSLLAAGGQQVVVTINYRLNLFGFFGLVGADAVDWNAGLSDQSLALQWVQQNIAAFGGDPARVTIGGQSAGGTSVLFHTLAPPPAAVLPFRAAIIESPGIFVFPNVTMVQALAQQLAAIVGCRNATAPATIACLQQQPAALLLQMAGAMLDSFLPVVGPLTAYPAEPYGMLQGGKFAAVPLLIGHNQQEGNSFAYGATHTLALTNAEFQAYAAQQFAHLGAGVADMVISLYSQDGPPPASQQWFAPLADALGAYWVDCGTLFVAQAFAAAGAAPVHLYEFVHHPVNAPLAFLNATHSSELSFVFNLQQPYGLEIFTAAEQLLALQMGALWSAFIASGSSPAVAADRWPASPLQPAPPVWLPLMPQPGPQDMLVIDLAFGNSTTASSFDYCDVWVEKVFAPQATHPPL